MPKKFDVFIIGGGSGGVRAARVLAAGGLRVGLAENSKLGGTCVNLGCVPKKLFVYASAFSRHFADARGYGWRKTEPESFNWTALIEAKNAEISRLNRIYEELLLKNRVNIFKKEARFLGETRLRVGDEEIIADKIIIASGSVARRPDIVGIGDALVSDDMFHLERLPSSIIIVGGGYIALEFASILSGLGVRVTLVHRGKMPLRGFDEELRAAAARQLTKSGITLLLNTEVTRLGKDGTVYCKDGRTLKAEKCLCAVGREANCKGLDLARAKIATVNGAIKVDNRFATSNSSVFAIGDVKGGWQLTPVAIAEGQHLAMTLLGDDSPPLDYRRIPTAVFMQPPLAAVGISQSQAEAEGLAVEIHRTSFYPMQNLLAKRDEKAFIKIIADEKTKRVLGIHLFGDEGGEIIQGFAAAMGCGITTEQLRRTMPLHPTLAEEVVTLPSA